MPRKCKRKKRSGASSCFGIAHNVNSPFVGAAAQYGRDDDGTLFLVLQLTNPDAAESDGSNEVIVSVRSQDGRQHSHADPLKVALALRGDNCIARLISVVEDVFPLLRRDLPADLRDILDAAKHKHAS